ncbi:MAG: hypothetical protein P1V51_02610 [Deltaproteobacteria bacterium]|nr:hypothetical protein [Deltaproteobacteria bacterium]
MSRPRSSPALLLALLLGIAACGSPVDAGDGGAADGSADAGPGDAGGEDGGVGDAGQSDGGESDAGLPDGGGSDGGSTDGGESDGGAPDGGDADGGSTDGGGGGPTPPALPTYSGGVCPTLNPGPDRSGAVNTGFGSSGDAREFRLVVPTTHDPANPAGLVIGWHWLNASSGSFYDDGEVATAAEATGMIFALLDRLETSGNKAYQFDWPFVETWGAEKEVVFHEDVIACVGEQFGVDPAKIHGMGVSAGGLWLTYLSTLPAIDRFATVVPISGGLGADPLGFWAMQYAPQANKFPAVVVWGGPTDNLVAVDFHAASQAYRDALIADGHFVVTCMHDAGHAVPPMDPPPGETMFHVLWTFMQDHPWGTPAGTSPYQATGLSAGWPDWCQIATP